MFATNRDRSLPRAVANMLQKGKRWTGQNIIAISDFGGAAVGRKEELHQVIEWLTGFNDDMISKLIDGNATFEAFFAQAQLNPNAHLITGLICGYRIEEIENPLTRNVRYLDKLVDELAKGRKMEKILR